MTRAVVLLVAVLTLAACGGGGGPAPWSEPPSLRLDLRAELTAAEVPLLGDVDLHVDLYRGPDVETRFEPTVPEGFRGTVEGGDCRPLGDGQWQRWTLHLRPVRGPGPLLVPPFRAEAHDGELTATTPELSLEVGSLLADDAPAAVEAPAPPYPTPVDWVFWGLIAVAVLVAAFATWWLFLRRRRERTQACGVPLSPHGKALRELARLRKAPRTTEREVEQFYVDVSKVLRVYLEERFGFHSPEQTTEEFLVDAERGDVLTVAQRQALRRFLSQCDLVKFAGQHPDEAVHAETFEIAEEFVETTRPDRSVVAPEPLQEAVS